MLEALATTADRLNTIEPTLRQALLALNIASALAGVAVGVFIGGMVTRAARR
jgi:hypothetical protein